MGGRSHAYLSPKCCGRAFAAKGGNGVFACEPIMPGELICLWGGRIVAEAELDPNMADFNQRVLQIEDGFDLETPLPLGPSDYFNHSCEPNTGFTGQIGLVAMRDIDVDEEVTFDYAMCDGSDYDEFTCCCGTQACRGQITGTDWARPELWEKYDGYFMPYLARRISALKAAVVAPA